MLAPKNHKHDWIQPGVKALYHSIIGDPDTAKEVVITHPARDLTNGIGRHRNWVTWVEGKSACVSCDALKKVKTQGASTNGSK